jgi:hypothetical protein
MLRFTPQIRIARLNADAYKPPNYNITGYPTIVLWPATRSATKHADGTDIANVAKQPVEYKGDRTVEALGAFVKENGGWGIDLVGKE